MSNFAHMISDNASKAMQAMVFAAGLGTRLKPLTDRIPKALVEVGGQPLLQHVLNRLEAAGAVRVVVNVHHFSNQIISFLENHDFPGLDIRVSDESDLLLETGGGLKKASSLFHDSLPILIHNVDILSNVDLAGFYHHAEGQATLLVSDRPSSRKLLFDESMRLVGWTNVQTGEVKSPYPDLQPESCLQYAFSGIHTFSPTLFHLMEPWPDRFGIIDFYLSVCHQVEIKGYLKEDLRLMDVGKLDTLQAAETFLHSL
jgi:NDP-sugar pyrophosphorylase family protein